jgi:hypothetical protein
MEYNTSNNQLWFNQNGEEEEEEVVQTPDSDANQSPQPEQAVSTVSPSMGDSEELDTGISPTTFDSSTTATMKATPTGGFFGRLFNENTDISAGGYDYETYPRYGLPPENNPEHADFDPEAEGSKDDLGNVRQSYRQQAVSSGANFSKRSTGKMGSLGGGFGSGSTTTVVTPPYNGTQLLGAKLRRKNMLPLIGGALVLGTIGYFSFVKK